MQHICRQHKKEGKSIGFVPTMGFLHAGHASLLAISAHQNQITVLSIFVNPTQFNQSSDYEHYPIDIEHDLVIAQKNQVDYVFIPQKNELYADEYVYQVQEQKNSFLLEGEFRPGHFTGVLTIVLKLLNIVSPDKLYLGEKDYQQYCLIKGMVEAFFLPIEIIACSTIREADGLAMSSRNVRLKPEERRRAPIFYKALLAKTCEEARNLLINNDFKVDYIIDLDHRRYGAVWLGETRLIDNVELTVSEHSIPKNLVKEL